MKREGRERDRGSKEREEEEVTYRHKRREKGVRR